MKKQNPLPAALDAAGATDHMRNENSRELSRLLLDWYKENHRILPWRSEPTPYRVWISEIMLQQTRVEAGKAYFLRFVEQLPDAAALAAASDEQLMKLWEGLGYYSRVRNLKKAAQMITADYGGCIPADAAELQKLPGIGSYTAGAIASIAYGVPSPAVDGNVLRVLSRLWGSHKDIGLPATKKEMENAVRAMQEQLAAEMPPRRSADETAADQDPGCAASGAVRSADGTAFLTVNPVGDLTQALMELGALVCLPGTPHCELCPWKGLCVALRNGEESILPVKTGKKSRIVEEKTVLLIRNKDKTLLHKRPARGMLAGLWEWPNMEGRPDEEALSALLRSWGLRPAQTAAADFQSATAAGEQDTAANAAPASFVFRPLPSARHVFTHKEWDMVAYEVEVMPAGPQDSDASTPSQGPEKPIEPQKPGAQAVRAAQPGKDCVWADSAQREAYYALPSAFSYWR